MTLKQNKLPPNKIELTVECVNIPDKNLLDYSMKIAMIELLLNKNLISEKEYNLTKNRIMKKHGIISDLTSCYPIF